MSRLKQAAGASRGAEEIRADRPALIESEQESMARQLAAGTGTDTATPPRSGCCIQTFCL